MINFTECTAEIIFGIFELDDSGIVRYSKPTSVRSAADDGPPLVGRDFFELVGFRNGVDLKRHFKRFIESRRAADKFTFDCLFADEKVSAKVMMTRVFRTDFFPPEGAVMLEISTAAGQ
jgi:hypothetical protein